MKVRKTLSVFVILALLASNFMFVETAFARTLGVNVTLDGPSSTSISAGSDGGLWWNETNETVKWCGYLGVPFVYGNTLLY